MLLRQYTINEACMIFWDPKFTSFIVSVTVAIYDKDHYMNVKVL